MATTVHKLKLSTGEEIFYRAAGPTDAPTVLLLHGFPSSSHQYRNLIPILAAKYRVLAPDIPGFGFTVAPEGYKYTFANFATTIGVWLKEIPNPPEKYALYIFDYGAPTGLRHAIEPENQGKITAIIAQNGNAYVEGLGDIWKPIQKYWGTGTAEDRESIRVLTTPYFTNFQYTTGAKDASAIAPESYTLDQALMDRPGNADIQLDIFYDYRTNLDVYPAIQEWFRKTQVPVLAAWGKHDQIFIPPGAEAFKRDLPDAEVHLLDAGHFVLETNLEEIAGLILPFLEKHLG
jgi:pimeloyl-ACP methyl ester carboxylesterase